MTVMCLSSHPIVFFDGICNLCNGSVQWLLRHDHKAQLLFAPLQSSRGEEARKAVSADKEITPDSLLLYDRGHYYQRSDAVIGILSLLGGRWRIPAYLLRLIPRTLRDAVYQLIARYRYIWFGRRQQCMIPKPEWKARFTG